MRYLVFSDSHLSNKFEQNKFNFLKKITSSADRVIINGDFWEGYNCTFNQFINSSWKKLFPLLKKKKTVYLYGNHDKKKFSNKNTLLFSDIQTMKYKLQSGDKTFYIEHGDRLMPLLDAPFQKYPVYLNNFMDAVEGLMFRIFGKIHLFIFCRLLNKKIKKLIFGKFTNNEYLVCGHTNFAEIDLKNNFINSGFIKHGIGQYLIIEDGKISLHEERY